MNGNAKPELKTVEETARLLYCHSNHVCDLIRRGELEASKIGRRYLIRASEVDALVERSKVVPVVAPADRSDV